MKVKVLNSFSDSVHGTKAQGDVIDLPDGVDWLRAGLVEPLPEPEPTPEAPAEPKPARKKKGQ